MQEIAGLGKKGDCCVVLTTDGKSHEVAPSRLTVKHRDNGHLRPCFDPENKRIVCGTEEADELLQNMLKQLHQNTQPTKRKRRRHYTGPVAHA